MTRFLLSAMPFTGHVTPLCAVAAALVNRGHDVRFYTGAAFQAKVEASGARFVGWQEAPDFDENDLSTTFPRLVGRKGLRQVFINLEDVMIATAPAQARDLAAEFDREPWDAIAADETSVGVVVFAELRACPAATVAILPLNIAVTHGPPSGLGLTPGRNVVTKSRDALLRAAVPLLSRPLTAPLARARAEAGLPPANLTFEKAVFSARLVVASGCPLLDYERRGHPDRVRFVGQLASRAGPADLPTWWGDLDGRTVVHITQGTQNIDPADLIRPALDALGDRDDLLLVVSTGVPGRDELPFPVPSNTRVGGFLPYAELLPRSDVMITNGGWGSTLAALAHGIPLVIAGGDLDKPEIAARVAWAGAGVNLRTGTPSSAQLARAFARVTSDPSFRDAAARVATQLNSLGGAPRAAELLEEFAAA
ncbi:glycosyltransferase [Microbacterium yannicii]|uniref:glycosyltransferase n=1 Tax=Microbacterium yannicii TaxID=671622 RepID=UPI0002DC9E65|nr:nucleotide disphospho-sugar-binding domain-containing protein [Microbacterium yannicii]